jgi:hypothetical protein
LCATKVLTSRKKTDGFSGGAPLLEEVRRMLCEPEQTEKTIDGYWARTNETSGFDT